MPADTVRPARILRHGVLAACLLAGPPLCAQLDQHALAVRYFGNDAPWFEQNIPFLEIDDPAIQDTYYYRWKLYRSHLRQIGRGGVIVTEFLPDVPWARHPDTDLNDSSAFHIREGRWLRDPAIVASLIDHLYTGGGNDRHFSEWIAAATLDAVRVTGDAGVAMRNLPAMRQTFELWDDHFDAARGLYWIEPLLDATEYTISSIDASGAGFTDAPSTDQNRNGFTQGFAFRPSINSYQYANALAIANFAERNGDRSTAQVFQSRAGALRQAMLQQLWNPSLQHFTDVYQRSTATVRSGDFIRGRELVGYTPWMFGLVAPGVRPYSAAWSHVGNAPSQLNGAFGLRTAEPSYPRYMAQYRLDAATGKSECQWNGPSWPFQTSQTLTGLANLLQAAGNSGSGADRKTYLHLLRQYTAQHRLASGVMDLQEDYNPDTGAPIVGLARSHHYNHSTYNDLLLSGLVGIQPRDDDTLQITPLLPSGGAEDIRYFALQSVRYHGRDLTVRYDQDGSHYGRGRGLTVECNGRRIAGPRALGMAVTIAVPLCPAGPAVAPVPPATDLAVNVWEHAPTAFQHETVATVTSSLPDRGPYQAIDGRLWFFPEVPNGWQPLPTDTAPSLTLRMPAPVAVKMARLALFDDGAAIAAPAAIQVSANIAGQWQTVATASRTVGNGITDLIFQVPVQAADFRFSFATAQGKTLRVIEAELF